MNPGRERHPSRINAGLWRRTGSMFYELLLLVAIFFVAGWVLQFVGHAFERKPPEFLKDWRFLFVGLRWWLAKLRGRA